MDLISLLSAPIAYLEQEKYDFCKQDKDGFTVIHYAILMMDFDWLNEAIEIDKNSVIRLISTNSKFSSINLELLPKLRNPKQPKKQFNKENSTENAKTHNIPFGENGYSPIHLLVWMMFHYEKETHIDKDKILTRLSDEFNHLFKIDSRILAIKDGNGLSVLEYIIMLNQENIMQNKINSIKDLTFIPKLKNTTLQKLIDNKAAKDRTIRLEIYNKITCIQNKELSEKILNSNSVEQNNLIEDDGFKL